MFVIHIVNLYKTFSGSLFELNGDFSYRTAMEDSLLQTESFILRFKVAICTNNNLKPEGVPVMV